MRKFCARAALLCSLALAIVVNARAADVEKGKVVFERCAACHSLEAGKNEDAPTLKGIIGRKIASVEEFRYSAAMKRSDVVWNQSTLDTFLEDPQAFIPGNRMPFDGLKEKSEREDLLAYLEVATKTALLKRIHPLPRERVFNSDSFPATQTRPAAFCGALPPRMPTRS